MKHPITILMDDRERSPLLLRTLAAMDDVTVHVRRLSIGDYQVDEKLRGERKTLKDFALSVIDGRFFRQMERLAASPLKGVLILEGSSRELHSVGIRREALQGALVFTSIILNISVLRSMDPTETARLIVYAARQIRLAGTGMLKRSGRRPRGKRKRQLYMLQGLPGVGPTRAARLLDRFGSVQNVLNASLKTLLSVDGIGNDTAQSIRWAVREPIVSYGIDAQLMFEI
jgi:DNA excision repair protein ERCC-4